MSNIFENLVTVEELLLLLNHQYCRRTIYRWLDEGIPHKKIRSRLWFPKDEAINWILSDGTEEPALNEKDKKQLKMSLTAAKATIENLKSITFATASDCIDDIEVACCDILMKIKTERMKKDVF